MHDYILHTAFDFNCHLLEKKFRCNSYKTHSCFDDTIMHPIANKFWLSYTVEDSNFKRCKKNDDFNGKFIVFRLYIYKSVIIEKKISTLDSTNGMA
jgi:hypothetical protein